MAEGVLADCEATHLRGNARHGERCYVSNELRKDVRLQKRVNRAQCWRPCFHWEAARVALVARRTDRAVVRLQRCGDDLTARLGENLAAQKTTEVDARVLAIVLAQLLRFGLTARDPLVADELREEAARGSTLCDYCSCFTGIPI